MRALRLLVTAVVASGTAVVLSACNTTPVDSRYADRPVEEWPSYRSITALRTSGGDS